MNNLAEQIMMEFVVSFEKKSISKILAYLTCGEVAGGGSKHQIPSPGSDVFD